MHATTATCRTGRASIPGSVKASAYRSLASTRLSMTGPSVAAPGAAEEDADVVILMTLLVGGGPVLLCETDKERHRGVL